MYLEQLTIRSDDGIIRDIKFKMGLNLIVDETTDAAQDSGNNVGKTTLLRIIDYCLGGKKETLYKEREFKHIGGKIHEFLDKRHVVFTLKIKSRNGKHHTVTRPIKGKSSIDDQEISSDGKFNEKLGQLIFQFNSSRPTFRQLMNKFVRIESHQLNYVLYFMHQNTDYTDYEALFLFLFGYRDTDVLAEKRQVVNAIKKLKVERRTTHSVEQLEQELHLIEKEIAHLENLKKGFDFGENAENDLNILKTLQSSIVDLRQKISKLSVRLDVNSKTVEQLRKLKSDVNAKSIKMLYDNAKLELNDLNSKFEDVLNFHNKMIDNKIKYIEKTIHELPDNISKHKSELHKKCAQEATILRTMSKQDKLGEYDSLNAKLQDKSRERGQREGQMHFLKEIDSKLESNQKRLSLLDEKIKQFLEDYKGRLSEFNEHFSSLSERLYGDKYYLATKYTKNNTTGTNTCLLEIGNLNENVGTGKKKAEISALDIAYLKYAEEKKWAVPYFVLHDQLESVFENQIKTLFKMANQVSGQFVVSVLSDKLKKIDKQEVENNTILKLAQHDKLFKIP